MTQYEIGLFAAEQNHIPEHLKQAYARGFEKKALSADLITRAGPRLLGRLMGSLNIARKTIPEGSLRQNVPKLLNRLQRVGSRLEYAGMNTTIPMSRIQQANLIDMGAAASTRGTSKLQDLLTQHFYPTRVASTYQSPTSLVPYLRRGQGTRPSSAL